MRIRLADHRPLPATRGAALVAAAVLGGAAARGVAAVPHLAGDPDQGLTLLDQVGGAGTAIVATGDRAYLGLGPRVLSLDMSLAREPQVVASTAVQAGFFDDLAAGGGIVAGRIGSAGKVTVWRGGDDGGLHPVAILDDGEVGTPFHGLAVDSAGGLWMSAGGALGLWDVGQGPPAQVWRGEDLRGAPAVVGDLVLVGRGQGGLAVVGPGADGRVAMVGSVDGPLLDAVVAAGGERALGLTAGPGGATTVVVYTVADPTAPRELGRFPLRAGPKVASDDDRMVAAWGGTGLVQVLDASAAVPRPGGDWQAFVPLDVAVADGEPMVAAAEGLYVLDASNPARPIPIGRPEVGAGVVSDLRWRGDFVYVAHGAGLNVVRVSGGNRLVPLGSAARPEPRGGFGADLLYGPRDLALGNGAEVFAASGEGGVVVYDVAAPAQPSVMASLSRADLGDDARAVAYAAGRLYVGGSLGVTVLDARVPGSLTPSSVLPTEEPVQGLAVAPGRLLVALGAGGLMVATLDGAGIPGATAAVPGVDRADDVAVAGGVAVAVGAGSVVEIDPQAGTVLRRLDGLAGPGEAVALGSGVAYVGGPGGELVAVTVEAGQDLRVLGRRRVRPGSAVAVAAGPGGVLTAGGFMGLRLLAPPGAAPGPRPVYLPRTAAGGAPE